jgi:predicted kinase
MLIAFRGLPGTGKTHLVRRLVRTLPDLLVLSRDGIRASLISRPTFADDEKALVDDMILTMAVFLLDRGRSVVIDGMALSSAARVDAFARTAESRGQPFFLVECTCSEATALERLGRDTGGHPAGDRGPALYRAVRERWEKVVRPALVVDTDTDPAASLAAVLRYIGRGAAGADAARGAP